MGTETKTKTYLRILITILLVVASYAPSSFVLPVRDAAALGLCVYPKVYPEVINCWPDNFNGRGGDNAVIARNSSTSLPYYDYAPAVMADTNGYKMWWCGGLENPDGDHIMYSTAPSVDGPWTTPVSVFNGTSQAATFDRYHTCDPSVVKVNGTYYMYYGGLGTEPVNYTTTNIGVASSPDGVNWTRLNGGNPIITPRLPVDPANPTYGAGQASVTYVDGKYYMVYTDSTGKYADAGGYLYVLRSTDPTFWTGTEELVGPGNFQPYNPSVHAWYPVQYFMIGIDWLYDDQMQSFVFAWEGTQNRLDMQFMNKDLSAMTVDPFSVKPYLWSEGPGLVRTPEGHMPRHPYLAGKEYVDLFRAVSVGDQQNIPSWDLAHTGFDINLPGGSHDVTNSSTVAGWACDGDNYSQPLTVKFYDQNHTLLGSTVANQQRSDVSTVCGGTTAHGFTWTPQGKGGNCQIYAYAVNIGNPTMVDRLLAGGGSGGTASCKARIVPGDYDGDGKTDIATFRPSDATWYINNGAGTTSKAFGAASDIPVPGDYDGDGKTDIATFRPSNGTWNISGLATQTFGSATDIPVPADYSGDGKTDIAVYSPGNGTWYIAGVGQYQFGVNGDIPVPGDYNGDGKSDVAVYRPSTGVWYILNIMSAQWGVAGDKPVPGDYDGDGKSDLAIFRPSDNSWWIQYATGTSAIFNLGSSGDLPVPGDFDGNGKTDIAVWRPSNGTWYFNGSPSVQWGWASDIPVNNYLVRSVAQAATPVAGDLNLDHIVNSIDWSIMNSKWFTTDATADLNHDGIVNAIDYSMLNANWFKTW